MTIKIHLDDAEAHPVRRLARKLNVSPEDIAYSALDRLMLNARDEAVQAEIMQARSGRKDNLPLWADTAGSVHAYEGMPDCEPEKSKYSV
jgi:hypothetical protein